MNKLTKIVCGLGIVGLSLSITAHGELCKTTPRFIADKDKGVVTDSLTGLMWQRCADNTAPLGSSPCNGSVSSFLGGWFTDGTVVWWDEALQAAKASRVGGYDDWRLPNIKELQSVMDATCQLPHFEDANMLISWRLRPLTGIYYEIYHSAQFWTSTPAPTRDNRDPQWTVWKIYPFMDYHNSTPYSLYFSSTEERALAWFVRGGAEKYPKKR